jgi:hypothetical protein
MTKLPPNWHGRALSSFSTNTCGNAGNRWALENVVPRQLDQLFGQFAELNI